MNRKKLIEKIFDFSGSGLEIGPCHSPFFPKKMGYKVKSLDCMSADQLRKKYASDPDVDISKIEDVDFVWNGEPYSKLVGTERFDWIFASHVVEHTPDLISFINECASILKPDGSIFLVVPDKRYTFDVFRQQSSLASIIDTHMENRKTPSLGAIVDFLFYIGIRKDEMSLLDEISIPYLPMGNMSKQFFEEIKSSESYQDTHVWTFTPNHFRLIIETLFNAGLINVRESCFHDTVGIEFYMALSVIGKGTDLPTDTLIKKALKEGGGSRWPSAGRGTFWPLRIIAMLLDGRIFGGRLKKFYRRLRNR
jgi:SAM-dependent methyltransferase